MAVWADRASRASVMTAGPRGNAETQSSSDIMRSSFDSRNVTYGTTDYSWRGGGTFATEMFDVLLNFRPRAS